MDPIATFEEMKRAKQRIADLERTLAAEQSRLSLAHGRISALEHALVEVWSRRGTVQGRR